MFKLFVKEANQTTEVSEPVATPKRIAFVPTMSDAERCEYIATATRVGAVNGAVKREMVLALCAARGLGGYSLGDVEKYLDDQFGSAKWGWKPLRDIDAGKLVSGHTRENGQILSRVYSGQVPLPVLMTVEAIAAEVPDVHFYVSDLADETAEDDPFLAVTASGMSMVVVERWDEPNFRIVADK